MHNNKNKNGTRFLFLLFVLQQNQKTIIKFVFHCIIIITTISNLYFRLFCQVSFYVFKIILFFKKVKCSKIIFFELLKHEYFQILSHQKIVVFLILKCFEFFLFNFNFSIFVNVFKLMVQVYSIKYKNVKFIYSLKRKR